MLKSIGTYRGRSVYVETTPEGDRIPFYHRYVNVVRNADGSRTFFRKPKLIRVYISPEQIENFRMEQKKTEEVLKIIRFNQLIEMNKEMNKK